MRYILLLLQFPFFLFYAQESPGSIIDTTEVWLLRKFEELHAAPSDADKENLNREIMNKFESILPDPLSFDYPFDSLKRIGKLYSPDHKIRLISWNIPASDGTNTCYGFLQCRQKRNEPCLVFGLSDRSFEINNPETSVLNKEMWWGALYYDILMNKSKGRKLYTLIGFNPHDRYSDKKVVDVLTFGRDMQPSFGLPVFRTEEGIKYRLIFEFSPDIVMRLRYEHAQKMIVLDHLSPIQPALEGHYRFYAPDGSYDGFKFRKGMWEYQPNIDVRNQ